MRELPHSLIIKGEHTTTTEAKSLCWWYVHLIFYVGGCKDTNKKEIKNNEDTNKLLGRKTTDEPDNTRYAPSTQDI